MNTIYNTEELNNKFFELVENADNRTKSNGQLVKFFEWLYSNDFLRNLTKDDYEYMIEENELSLPILRNHKMAIGIDIWDNYSRIGFDPSDCFDKISKCSIVTRFPLSKREEERFYSLLNKIMDKKSSTSKTWFKAASRCWYGDFCNFGNV